MEFYDKIRLSFDSLLKVIISSTLFKNSGEKNSFRASFVFDTSKSLDISKISAYKAQQEELVQGTYKVVSVEQKAGSTGGVEWKTYGIKDYAEQNNLKPTIKTSKSGKKHYIFNIAGKDKDFPESQYEKNRTFSIEVKTEFEAPRRVVHLKYDD